jgi:hypothetical protein
VVEERFWCPDRTTPRLVREVRVRDTTGTQPGLVVRTGSDAQRLERKLVLGGGASPPVILEYCLAERGPHAVVEAAWREEAAAAAPSVRHWSALTAFRSSSDLLNHLFAAARNQLPAVVRASGVVDGGIWQYNLEWLRDQAAVASALVMLGDFALARTMLSRLLRDFVTADGDTVDSSRHRAPQDVELDQNGELLLALKSYVDWTGDVGLVREHWPRVAATAEFPLRDIFRHPPSGLLHNGREYWERHAAYGIEDGLELTHQLFASLGLTAAAELGRLVGQTEHGTRWEAESARLKQALLHDPQYALVDAGHFIKRRGVDGNVQHEIAVPPGVNLPRGVPLTDAGPHYLNPDTSSVLPISLEYIDPRSDLAGRTLREVEQLWNQRWDGGGYGRYHVSSEPDSPGPWPFPSLFVARAWWEAGDDERMWRVLNWLAAAPGGKAGAWFEFYGPRPVPPCPQVGIMPWTWAELVTLLVHHILGVRPSGDQLWLRPRLPVGVDRIEATFRVRDHRLRLRLRRAEAGQAAVFRVGGQAQPATAGGLRLPWPPDPDIEIDGALIA